MDRELKDRNEEGTEEEKRAVWVMVFVNPDFDLGSLVY